MTILSDLESTILTAIMAVKVIASELEGEIFGNHGAVKQANRDQWCSLSVNIQDLIHKLQRLENKIDEVL